MCILRLRLGKYTPVLAQVLTVMLIYVCLSFFKAFVITLVSLLLPVQSLFSSISNCSKELYCKSPSLSLFLLSFSNDTGEDSLLMY